MSDNIAGVDVSRETIEALEHFAQLLGKWTRKINLISKDTVQSIWDRHIVDSVQLYPYLPVETQNYTDLGSGGGLPAIVLASLIKGAGSNAVTTMIESDTRKCTFLRTAIRELDLDATVISQRITDVPTTHADVVTARALAPLPLLLEYVDHHCVSGGIAILPKGRKFASELADAHKKWHFTATEHASLTDPDARILEVRNIARVTP